MSITDARLAQIEKLEEEIKEKTNFLEGKQADLKAIKEIAASMSEATMHTLSQSASTSLRERGTDDAVSIAESVTRTVDIIIDLQRAISVARSELEALENEKNDLEEFTGRA